MRKCSLDKIYSVFEEIAKTAKLYVPLDEKDGNAVKSEASGLRKTNQMINSLAHRTTWLRSDFLTKYILYLKKLQKLQNYMFR